MKGVTGRNGTHVVATEDQVRQTEDPSKDIVQRLDLERSDRNVVRYIIIQRPMGLLDQEKDLLCASSPTSTILAENQTLR